MKKVIYLIILSFISVFYNSCAKSEGTGGQAVIKGKVIVENINVLGDTLATYDAQDQDVFIIYGNTNNTHNDNTETSYDGTFEFKFLNTGEYTIFTYSDCIDCPKGRDSLIMQNISISEREEIIEIANIHIANFI